MPIRAINLKIVVPRDVGQQTTGTVERESIAGGGEGFG